MAKKAIEAVEEEKLSITFEQAVARLEEIVHSLENGEAPLQDSLSLFEEGVKLTKHCNALLDEAEQRVEIVSK